MFPKSNSSSIISIFGIIADPTTGTYNYFPPLINIMISPLTILSSLDRNLTYKSLESSELILPLIGYTSIPSGNFDV